MRNLVATAVAALVLGVLAAVSPTTAASAPTAGVGSATPTITWLRPRTPYAVGKVNQVGVRVSVDGVPASGTVHLSFDGVEIAEPQELSEEFGVATFELGRYDLPPGWQFLTFTYDGDATTAAGAIEERVLVHDRAKLRMTILKQPTRKRPGLIRVQAEPRLEGAPLPTGAVVVRLVGSDVRRTGCDLDDSPGDGEGRLSHRVSPNCFQEHGVRDGIVDIKVRRVTRGRWTIRARYLGDDYYGRRHTERQRFRVR